MSLLTNLISYWKMDEASGNALDAHGSNELTDTNTVGSAGGKVNNARDFELSSSEYFTKADNTDLSTGDIDFTISCWVNFESLPGFPGIVTKDGGSPNREYGIYYGAGGGSNRIGFYVSAAGLTIVEIPADTLGSPSVSTWYFIVAWHDAAANTINIQVNNGGVDSLAHSTGVFDGAADFRIGTLLGTEFWDGLIDEVGFWKRVLTSDERTSLYNSGNGKPYSEFGDVALPFIRSTGVGGGGVIIAA
jgi:hypothetical protein